MVVLLVLLDLSPADAAREISANRECSICHLMWLSDFNRQGVTPLIAYNPKPTVASGKQDVVSTERMCISCHDGFVRDSRFAFANRGHFHPTGVVPSDKVKIPEKDGKPIFPLNDDGKVYCGTCHSAHTVGWDEHKVSGIFLRHRNPNSAICVACHLERSTGPQEGNHPVFKTMNEAPAGLTAAGGKFGENNTVICQSCHRVHGAPEKKLLAVRNENSELCGHCHADRAAGDRAQAGRLGTHPVNVKPEKATIPEALIDAGGKLGHGGTVVCQTCHKPHHAEPGAKILVQKNPQSALCIGCHKDQRKVESSKHNLALGDAALKNVRGQDVETAGTCSACHLPHNGRGPKMWARPIDDGVEPMAALCLSCHRDGGTAAKYQIGEHSHPLGRDLARLGNPVDLPGFSAEGVKTQGDGKGKVTCASCHDPHQWDARNPAAVSRPGDPSGPENKFLRRPNTADSGLCLACHRDKDSIVNSKHDLAKMAPDEKNIRGQTAAGSGPCANCHLPHNGAGPRMWARKPKAGVDAVAATCLSCHDENGIAHNKTIGGQSHPTGVPIARLGIEARPGEWRGKTTVDGKPLVALPLHDAHGAPAGEGGNVTCGTCHDPHKWSSREAADPRTHPKDVKGSGESRFLRLPNDNSASLCANCHVDKGAIALSKHNLKISAPGEKNVLGLTTGESGVCGSCHLPHNGRGAKMWARNSGSGRDEVEKRCTGCHQAGGVAASKQPGKNDHPLGVDPKAIGARPALPLFTVDGHKDAVKGRVSCATCHDLHQWQPGQPTATGGADARVEGGAADSFLRLPAAPAASLCVECHANKRNVAGTKHDLAVSAPQATNTLGKTVAESGVCGQCHLPHGAPDKLLLWGRPPGPAKDRVETLCRSCHSVGRIAEGKQPLRPHHPPHVTASTSDGRRRPGQARDGQVSEPQFPLFSPDGKRSNSGQITCPTCHNPHQWRAELPAEGSGRGEEGNATSSFLRNSSDYILCADCHGLDSIFRYKYFHGDISRTKHPLVR